MPDSPYDRLDDLLTRIHVARLRPDMRRRLLDNTGPVSTLSTLRALRAVEQCERSGRGASVGDVADYLAIEHSTASRTVAGIVDAGLVTKNLATEDQRRCVLVLTDAGREALAAVTERRREIVRQVVADWPDDDIATLLGLLERLATAFERSGAEVTA